MYKLRNCAACDAMRVLGIIFRNYARKLLGRVRLSDHFWHDSSLVDQNYMG